MPGKDKTGAWRKGLGNRSGQVSEIRQRRRTIVKGRDAASDDNNKKRGKG